MSTPSQAALTKVAAWLAECVTCDREHEYRVTKTKADGSPLMRSYADPGDGHLYDTRGSNDDISLLRHAARRAGTATS